MPKDMSGGKNTMESPINAPKPAGNPGPEPGGVPPFNPRDPLGVVPGGGGKK